MSNSLTAFNPAFWANEMQPVFYKENVAISVASTKLEETLSIGDTAHKPYRSALRDQTYTKGTDITSQDVAAVDETLTVDTAKIVPFYVDDLDKIQNKWDSATTFAQDAMRRLNNVIDRVVTNEYASAKKFLDAGDVGGSAGSAITVAGTGTVNVDRIFTRAKAKLGMLDVPMNGLFALVGPSFIEQLTLYAAGRATNFGDEVGDNGFIARRFGFEIRQSNNLPWSASLAMGTNPTANDTVTIAGVTFKFVSSIGTTAGNVLIGAGAANSLANLVAAVNGASGAGTTYIEPAQEDRETLINAGVVATAGSGTIAFTGYGDIPTAETLTAGGDVWSAQIQHALFGIKGATDLVLQKAPNVEFRTAEKRLGRYVYPWMVYGKKTFTQNKKMLVDVRISASGF
jgi:hypothetical protein